ncbi:MAG: MbnH family di-heme enzyme [Comamonas sp.]
MPPHDTVDTKRRSKARASRLQWRWLACWPIAVAAIAGCGGGSGPAVNPPAAEPWSWNLPAGWSPPVVPADNPMNAAKVELGRRLFHDVRLSGNGTQSCASCHAQASAFTDNRALARGSTGEVHPRNAQPLANVAYHTTLNWADPTVTTLEQQLLAPLFNTHPVELGVNDANRAEVLARLRRDPDYPPRFAAAFAGAPEPLSWDHVAKAIAAFERTLVSADSRYDRHLAGQATLTEAEARGMRLFFGERALCSRCHGSPNFNDQFSTAAAPAGTAPFHNTGLFNIGGTGAYPEPNRGVYELTRQIEDMGRFRAASLRNIELTAPYMHDGSLGTLEAVLGFYADGGRNVGNGLYAGDGRLNPYKDPLISQINIDAQDQADLVAFLKTLTDHSFVSNPQFSDPFAARSSKR